MYPLKGGGGGCPLTRVRLVVVLNCSSYSMSNNLFDILTNTPLI